MYMTLRKGTVILQVICAGHRKSSLNLEKDEVWLKLVDVLVVEGEVGLMALSKTIRCNIMANSD
jgi:hypothetical protein